MSHQTGDYCLYGTGESLCDGKDERLIQIPYGELTNRGCASEPEAVPIVGYRRWPTPIKPGSSVIRSPSLKTLLAKPFPLH